MKKILLLVTLGCIFVSKVNADDDSGVQFRNIQWGTHIDSVYFDGQKVDFVPVENNRSANAFKLKDDKMHIGTVKLNNLHYIFNENQRLTQVYFEADIDNRPDMSFILRHRFGEPDDIREMIRIKMYEWDLGDLKISLTEYPQQDIFTVTFASRWDFSEAYRINSNINDF